MNLTTTSVAITPTILNEENLPSANRRRSSPFTVVAQTKATSVSLKTHTPKPTKNTYACDPPNRHGLHIAHTIMYDVPTSPSQVSQIAAFYFLY